MKLAPYNARGINGRARRAASVAGGGEGRRRLPAGTEGAGREVSPRKIERASYGAIWHGQKAWNGVAVLVRDQEPRETRPGLPGDPDDSHSRYIEAAIDGVVIGCLYLPNGNPAPGPKFDYKLRWFERLQCCRAVRTRGAGRPCRRLQCHADGSRCLCPRAVARRCPVSSGSARGLCRTHRHRLDRRVRLLHPEERIYTFWKYFRNAFARDAGLRIDRFLFSPSLRERLHICGVDKFARGWEHTSDHAPVWIELDDD